MNFDTVNFEGITVDNASITNFGRVQCAITDYIGKEGKLKFNGKNMTLKQMQYVDLSASDSYGEVDLSGTYAPAATRLAITGSNRSSTVTSYISPYNSYVPYEIDSGASSYPNFLKKITLRDVVIPNLQTLRFNYNPNLEELDINLDTSNLTSMNNLFRWARKLKEEAIPFEMFSTSNVTNMSGVFSHCESITDYPRLHLWDFTNVTNAGGMFEYNKSIREFNLDYFAPVGLTSATAMFYNNSIMETVNLPNLNTSLVTSFQGMFGKNPKLTTLNLDFDFSSATTLANLFDGCTVLEGFNVISEDAPNVTTVESMFRDCSSITDLGGFDKLPLAQVTSFSYFLQGCKQLKDVELLTSAKPTYVSYMFNNMDANSISIPNLDTSAVTSFNYMFANNPNITNYTIGENFNTSSATSFSYMFQNSNIANFDLSRIDTSSATTLTGMFQGCKLTSEHIEMIRG